NQDIEGSGWTFLKTNYLIISIDEFTPLKAGSWIDLPKWIKDKKAVINVKNKDNLCFLYSIIAKLYPAEDNMDRASKYSQYINSIKTDGLKFPMKIDDIHKFERMNDLSIYVYSYDVDTKKIFTFRAPKLYNNNDDDESKIIDL